MKSQEVYLAMQGSGGVVLASGNAILRFHECQFMTNTAEVSVPLLPCLPLSLSVCPSFALSVRPSVCPCISQGEGAGSVLGIGSVSAADASIWM